jgi:hypothetical protein
LIANVPLLVIGLPEMLNTLGTVAATLVTVPLVDGFAQAGAPPVVAVKTCPFVPAAVVAKTLVVDAYVMPYWLNALDWPVPPFVLANVPASVIAPEVAEAGVKPVVPPAKVVTGVVIALLARSLTVPALFLKYNFSSNVLRASSPATKLPASGTADAVVL